MSTDPVDPSPKKKKFNLHKIMRALHRDVGFLLIGMVVIYAISGITMIYRDTDLFKVEKVTTQTLEPDLSEKALAKALDKKNLKIFREEDGVLYFRQGSYNQASGEAVITGKEAPIILKQFEKLHKASSKSIRHWFSLTFGALFLFLAISSFWMFKPGTRLFRRGLYLALAGGVGAIALFVSVL